MKGDEDGLTGIAAGVTDLAVGGLGRLLDSRRPHSRYSYEDLGDYHVLEAFGVWHCILGLSRVGEAIAEVDAIAEVFTILATVRSVEPRLTNIGSSSSASAVEKGRLITLTFGNELVFESLISSPSERVLNALNLDNAE